MRPGVSLGVLGYPGVSWGNQTDPFNMVDGHYYRVDSVHVCVCLYVFLFVPLCFPESCLTHNFIMHGGI